MYIRRAEPRRREDFSGSRRGSPREARRFRFSDLDRSSNSSSIFRFSDLDLATQHALIADLAIIMGPSSSCQEGECQTLNHPEFMNMTDN